MVTMMIMINQQTTALDMSYLVVGAMARDLVMRYVAEAPEERATVDIDLAVNVPSWEGFRSLHSALLREGFKADDHMEHRLYSKPESGRSWIVDIIPFGQLASNDKTIAWPPKNDVVMTVLGFSEAAEHAIPVRIQKDPEVVVPVASPAGMSLLKLIAWLARDVPLNKKDALDFRYFLEHYSSFPGIQNALYDEGIMDAQEFDETKAAAMKLGKDAAAIAAPGTKNYLRENLIRQDKKCDQLIRDMSGKGTAKLSECASWLECYLSALD